MNKLLLFCLLATSAVVRGQSASVYVDLESFNSNNSFRADSITIGHRAKRDIVLVGGNELKITSTNDSLDEVLRKECFAVKYNDSLFLNCKPLMRTMGYAPALYRSGKFIYFMACAGFGKLSAQNSSAAFGAIGGAAGAQKRYNYLVFLDSGDVIALNKKAMKGLLDGNPALLSRYLEEEMPDDPETIIKYLKDLH